MYNNKDNIFFRFNHKSISLTASVKKPEDLISRQRLARDLIQRAPVFAIYLQSEDPSYGFGINSIVMGEAEDRNEVQEIPKEYADIFPTELPDGFPPKRSHELSIKLTNVAEPRRSRIYRLFEWGLDELKSQLATLIRKGIIQPSASPWGSSVFYLRRRRTTAGGRASTTEHSTRLPSKMHILCHVSRTSEINYERQSSSPRLTTALATTRSGWTLKPLC